MSTPKNSSHANALSAVDIAINNAKQRKATRTGVPADLNVGSPVAASVANKRPRLSGEEKAARTAQKDLDRAAAKEARVAKRAEKQALRQANKHPAHMSKVAKAYAKLPLLGELATSLFGDITANFTRDQVTALALHLQHFNRVKATERALNQRVSTGASVTVVGGDPRYVGKTGTVTKAQRIRCYVSVDGVSKPIYMFTSDVEVAATDEAATGTEG